MPTVLMAVSEAVPFAKSGGLGEVAGSLPKALRRVGVDVRVIMPLYGCMEPGCRARMLLQRELSVPVGWRRQYCGVKALVEDGVPFYFLDNEYYFGRDRMYGYFDEAERFAFFCRAVLEAVPHLGCVPDIIHCHDWQTGLIGAYLGAHYRQSPGHQRIRTIFTVHNLKYQGVFDKSVMGDVVDLGWEHFTPSGIEFYDKVNFMKAGLVYADLLTTVSPGYAREICQPHFGEGLDGVLRCRGGQLRGIINGIDCDSYDPARDAQLFRGYNGLTHWLKRENKAGLQTALGLPARAATPVVAMISRLVRQKGLDLVAEVIDEMLGEDIQLVVMGDGEDWYRALFWSAACRHPDKVAPQLAFDDRLARRIWAGADIFLMPSLFEPCGLAQLIAMRYGCLPVVRETGGLRDTVVPYNEFSGAGTGFSFAAYDAHDMLNALRRACAAYREQTAWPRIVRQAMAADCSWDRPAREYVDLYEKLGGEVRVHDYREGGVPAGVSRQDREAPRESVGVHVGQRKIPGFERPGPGLSWSDVAQRPAVRAPEAGLLPFG